MVKREKLFHFSTPTIEASVPTPITNSICIHMWQFHATNCWFVGVLIGRTETNISLFCSLIYFFLEFLWGTFRYTCIICYSLKVIRGIKQIAKGGFVGISPHVKKPCRRARYWFLSFPLGHLPLSPPKPLQRSNWWRHNVHWEIAFYPFVEEPTKRPWHSLSSIK